MLLLVLDSKTLLLMEVVDDADEVVLVDSKPPPRLDPEPPPPMGMGLESLRVPLMRDSSSSSKGLTPVKSEDDVSDPPCRTLRGGATEVVEPPLGVSLDNSIGGGKPLEVAWKSDKLTIEDVCWDDDDLGVVLLSREDEEEEVGLLSELGMS